MSKTPIMDAHVTTARRRLAVREQSLARDDKRREEQALRDVQAILAMIISKYVPRRIYQWGSLLRPGDFRDYSDIDIAVEGVTDAETFFRLMGDVQKMTAFPVDLVQLETIASPYAEDIRRKGKKVYEQP